jgi:hypothetical protein
MNKLEEYFWNKTDKTLKIHKWHHYFKIYDKHFKRFIGKNPTVLEIGVDRGGSLEMWNYYFDNKCTIYGIDINPDCLNVPEKLQSDNIHISIGDQENRNFWQDYLKDKPKFDIVIEDGGHQMNQQIVTYEELYDNVSDNGVYLCEDLHTSYWNEYGGELNKKGTFIEYSKNFIDMINFYHIRAVPSSDIFIKSKKFRQITNSIHYYDSIMVLEKEIDLITPDASVR